MKNDNDGRGEETGPERRLIECEVLFRHLRIINEARRQARLYLLASRRTAIQRRLLMRILERGKATPTLHIVE